MNAVVFDIDTQVDFLDPAGTLYVPGSQDIAPNIQRLLQWASEHRVTTISPVCAHLPNDPEFQQFGPHCIEGTQGARRYFDDLPTLPRSVYPAEGVIKAAELSIRPGHHYLVQKRTFPMFANPWMAALRAHGTFRRVRCIVFGVATDVCVCCDVLDLCRADAHVSLVSDAIAGINPDDTRQALEEMQRGGAHVVTTADVTGDDRRSAVSPRPVA